MSHTSFTVLGLMLGSLWPILGWAVVALVFRGTQRAARHWWAAALLLGGLQGLCLLPVIHPGAGAWATWLMAPVGLAAVLVVHRGGQVFWRQPPKDRQLLLLLAAGVLAAGLGGISPTWQWVSWGVTAWGVAWVLWQCASDSRAPALKAFGMRTARGVIWPWQVLALVAVCGGCGCCLVPLLGLTAPAPGGAVQALVSVVAGWGLHGLALFLLWGGLCVHGVLGATVLMRLHHQLDHLSRHDSLTDVLNRRAMDDMLRAERARHLRSGLAYTVVMLDIDHFKSLNETYGRAAGDAVLISVAQQLRRTAREVDVVGRMGGEVFSLLLPNTGVAGGLQAAERIRMAIESRPVWWRRVAMAVTLSIGVAEVMPGAETIPALLARAEGALSRAKAQGGNCAVVAITDASEPTGVTAI